MAYKQLDRRMFEDRDLVATPCGRAARSTAFRVAICQYYGGKAEAGQQEQHGGPKKRLFHGVNPLLR